MTSGEASRRSLLKTGALASTGLALGLSGTTAAVDDYAEDEVDSANGPLNLADVTFLQLMAYHHHGAIEIAELAEERTDRQELLELAEMEIEHQAEELDEIEAILSDAGIEPGPVLQADLDDIRGLVTAIPGNPKPNELADLRNREDEEFDLRFIELFTYHHSGAIQLSQQVLREGQSPDVEQLANDIIEMQRGMIVDMYQWYLDWDPEAGEHDEHAQ